MISALFNSIFYTPLYNALVALAGVLPAHDIGLSVILLTLIVRGALAPLSKKSLVTQRKLRELEPTIKQLKKDYPDNQKQAVKMMELYRTEGVNPFSSVLFLLIQFPILIALYWVFSAGFKEGSGELYSFVVAPTMLNPLFLGLVDMTKPSILLGVIAGLSQYAQAHLMMPSSRGPTSEAHRSRTSFGEDFAHSMNLQMKYFFPVLVVLISLKINSAVVLYWIVNNLFGIVQELRMRPTSTAGSK